MSFLKIVAYEHYKNRYMIIRMAMFQLKSTYSSNRLGLLSMLFYPLSQLAVYWIVFGIGIRGGASVEGVPFVLWLSRLAPCLGYLSVPESCRERYSWSARN